MTFKLTSGGFVYLKIISAIFIFVNLFFIAGVMKRKFSVIDTAWGLGFILVAMVSYFHYPMSIRNAFLLIVTTIWGLRLGLYILIRSKGKPEDPRYTKLRKEWEPRENLQAYFKVFLLQGFFMFIISLPVSGGMAQPDQDLKWYNFFGLLIWLMGFTLEVYSDSYLSRFTSKPENKGKLCTSGPWRLCRYPNYLGEITLWYGVFLLGLGPQSWWTLVGPIMINVLIIKFSGVAPQEERNWKKPDYPAYAARTPRLLPFKLDFSKLRI